MSMQYHKRKEKKRKEKAQAKYLLKNKKRIKREGRGAHFQVINGISILTKKCSKILPSVKTMLSITITTSTWDKLLF